MSNLSVNKKRMRMFRLVVTIILTIAIDFPILFVIVNSLKSSNEIMLNANRLIPEQATIENYRSLLLNSKMFTFIGNSVFVALIGTVTSITISSLAGFVLSRFEYRPVKLYSRFLLMMQMFPLILSLIPLFIAFKVVGILNTRFSVILVYITMSLPFATWMFKGFFDSIPQELEEAAWIDGCSRAGAFRRIVLPLTGPGIIAVSIFTYLLCWNEYLIANIFLRKTELMTIPVGIQMFIQQFTTDWGGMFAASTTAMIPAFIIFLFFQKYIVTGVAAGAVKG